MSRKDKEKRLGRGLEVFFKNNPDEELFQEALKADDEGQWLIAFHLYMKVSELNGPNASKALNNAAVILAENGFVDKAVDLLKMALEIDPQNSEALDNLKTLTGGEEV